MLLKINELNFFFDKILNYLNTIIHSYECIHLDLTQVKQ